jgi:hypothetical protein
LYKEIVQKIIDLLKVDTVLLRPTIIKEYFFGRPTPWPPSQLPCIYVDFEGGPIASMGLGGGKKRYDHNYRATVVHRLTKEDVAEKFVYDKAEAVEANVKTNKTLGDLVTSAIVVDTRRVDDPIDFSLKQVRVTIKTFKQV